MLNSISKVYIQHDKYKNIISIPVYTAWYGFNQTGIEIDFFTWEQLKEKKIKLDNTTLVVGGIHCIYEALNQLGFNHPKNIDYPESLKQYLHRDIKIDTLNYVRSICKDNKFNPPIFIKPANEHKLFNGHILREYKDMLKTVSIEKDTKIWISEILEFKTEWRFFVLNNKIIGHSFYTGDPLILPNMVIVEHAICDFIDAPSAYVIDFGVTEKNETVLIEVNEGFAFGCYGLSSLNYIKMLSTRWIEMTT